MFDIDVSSYFGAPDPRTRQAAAQGDYLDTSGGYRAKKGSRGNHELLFGDTDINENNQPWPT